MTEQVQGGTVKQDTGEHILGSGLADEVKTAYKSANTHYTHTGALQTTKNSDPNGITISKRPDPEAFEDEEYGQILATSKQVYEYLKTKPNPLSIQQWENTVSLHRDTNSLDAFVGIRNVKYLNNGIRNVKYPQQFFKKNGEWYKTVLKNVTEYVDPIVDTSTAENLVNGFQVSVIMWEYNVEKDVFEKVAGDRIGNDQALFTNTDFLEALGQSTRQQALLETYVNILQREERFYNNEKLLDAQELAQLKVRDAEFTASEAAQGNVFSRSIGLLGTATAGALASVLPSAPVAAAVSAAPAAAYSAGAAAAGAGAAVGGTSAASAAPLTLAGAAAAAPFAAAVAAASAVAGVGGVAVSQFQQLSANAAVVQAETELKVARTAVETSKAANEPAQAQADERAKNLIEVLGSNRRSNELVNGLAESRARRQTFANVAQQHRILHQERSPNSANQNQIKRTLKSKSKRTPKSKCKKYQSRSRKTGHCRNKSKSRKTPCKSGKTRKGTGRCHKTKA